MQVPFEAGISFLGREGSQGRDASLPCKGEGQTAQRSGWGPSIQTARQL